MTDSTQAIQFAGCAIVDDVLTAADVAALADAVATVGDGANARNLLAVPAVAAIAASPAVRQLVEPTLGPAARPVRGILFDKTPAANWKVPWHQDLSIAVRRRVDAAGYGPWSVKAGVPHVQPPAAVLASMLTVRLHLDDCSADNGPLRVLPGSHAAGVLDAAGIAHWRATTAEVSAEVARGGAVLMRPLLLHASSAAAVPSRRRVVHIEFAAGPLPGRVEWFVE
jgi:ectoine hydroxylase-related dioxygenase (phytanoyl-CoA dioxygenase family)